MHGTPSRMTSSSSKLLLLFFTLLITFPTTIGAFNQNAFYYARQSMGQLYSELTRVRADNNRIDELYFMTYGLNKDGNTINGAPDVEGETLAKQHNVRRIMGIDNADPYYFDPSRVTKAFSKKLFKKVINKIVNAAAVGKYDGVILDFENVPKNARGRYVTFVNRLSGFLKAANRTLTVSVPCITSDKNGGYNIKELGKRADSVLVMAWDQYYSSPGPVASLPWAQGCINYVKSIVPATKIIMGVPTYAYRYGVTFPKRKVAGLGWMQAERLLNEPNIVNKTTSLNGNLMAPSTNYKIAHPNNIFISEVIWHENYDSIKAKTQFAENEAQIAGIGVYALGLDSPVTWDAIIDN